jgi:hypothetical protein
VWPILGLLAAQLLDAPLPEGNALVRGLASHQRQREAALDAYTYDILEVEEALGKDGAVKSRKNARLEVFHVRGRPLRRKVEEAGRPLSPKAQAKEDARVDDKLDAILAGKAAVEEAGVRLSAVIERFDFRAVAREEVDARVAIVLDFVPRPGTRELEGDRLFRSLAGRIWIDEAECEVVRAEIRSTKPIRPVLGLGARISALELRLAFRKLDDAVWLPQRVETLTAGRIFIFRGFRTRTTQSYGNYRRFQVENEVAPFRLPR